MFKNIISLAILAGLSLVGCKSIEGLNVDPSFTEGNLKSSGLVVGGVVLGEGTVPENKSDIVTTNARLAGKLKTKVVEERKEVKVATPSLLSEKLGEKKYEDFLKKYRTMGEVDVGLLKPASPSLAGIKYAAFGYVESDDVKNDRNETREGDTKNISMRTLRTLKTRYSVVDLHAQNIVWSGTITSSLSKENRYSERENALAMIVKAVANSKDNQEYPQAPTAESVLDDSFAKFADYLPED